MEIRQTQKLVQKLALTPQMKQSLHILQLPILELKNYVEKEIEENPVLENESEINQEQSLSEKINLEESSVDNLYNSPLGDYANELRKKKDYKESLITKPVTLQEVLIKQLRMCRLTKEKYDIAEFIIHQIDDNGYLNLSLEEIVAFFSRMNTSANKNITYKNAEDALTLIHTFEPVGIGARNLKECLLIQLRARGKKGTLPYKIVECYLSDVAKNRIRIIAKKLKIRPDKIKKAINEISCLEPKPGGLYSPISNVIVSSSSPDIVIERNKEGLEIIINNSTIPKIRISSKYKNILKEKDVAGETKTYIRRKINSALNLEKAISQRNQTLKRVANALLDIQKEFFMEGDISLLKPLTLKKIAHLVNRNESTISRVVNNKYIKTPYGVFKLNYFFTKPIKIASRKASSSEEQLSRESIKSSIFNIISEESKKNPINDTKISKILKKGGIVIARRTVAKYREELKIPPVHRRRKK